MVFGQLVITNNTQILNACKLEKTFVTGSIVHSFATLTFYQQFLITQKDFYSIYINPPEGCVIYDIKSRFNNKLTEFVVHKLEEPVFNGYYNTDSNPDAISLTLGEILPLTKVKIEITCTFTASLTSPNSFVFNIPADSSVLNTEFSSDIRINMLKQNLPKINISEGDLKINDGRLMISPFKLQKQLQIKFNFQKEIESAAFSSQDDNFNYIGLSMHPTQLKQNASIKQEIFLLIDCSGSMSGGKIRSAYTALVNFLNALPKNCYFNILRFGSTFERMFETSVENNPQNIEQSLKFASMLQADLGGTDIYSPLMSIIEEKPRKGYVRQVFALTDGEVENGANVIAACTANRHIMRVFPFGIGNDVNHAFLKDLANSTMGVAHFIDHDDTSTGISKSVLLTLKSSQVSAVVNNELHIEGVELFEVAPHPIPPLFADDVTHVILKYDKNGNKVPKSILISGEVGDSSYEEAVQVLNIGKSINFQKLFAYHNIRDMEDKLMNLNDTRKTEMIRENIVRLSMQCAVVSSFTGMFTVINGVEQKPQMDSKYHEQSSYVSAKQQYQYQQNYMQGCQQQMTQKQCWAQEAYAQMAPPMQQAAQCWGFSQNYPQPQCMPQFMQQQPYFPPPQTQHQQQFLQQPPQSQPPFSQQPQSCNIFQNDNNISIQKENLQKSPQNSDILDDFDQTSQSQKLDIFQDDPFVFELLKKQRNDGSWNDFSLVHDLVNSKNKNSTIEELLAEFPKVGNEIRDLSTECIITLLVIGWLYSQRKNTYESYKKFVSDGLNYIRSRTTKNINDDMSKNFHIIDNIPWKFHIFYF